MTRKSFVLDTNVLLHDPEALVKFPNSDVVIPVAVLEELSAMKRLSDERGKNARMVLRKLAYLKSLDQGDLHEGVKLENGSKVRIQLHSKTDLNSEWIVFLKNHKILLNAFLLSEQGEKVVFVSKDFLARIKAEAVGLESRDYENLKFSYKQIYHGVCKKDVDKMTVDLFYKDGKVAIEGEHIANEYCVMTSPENSTAVACFNEKSNIYTSLQKVPEKIWGIKPLNVEQKCAMDLLMREDINLVSLMGPAGTGKTLMALACGMRQVFDDGLYTKILISRPVIPLGKDIGYLPGTKEEKLYHWMQPIYDNLEFLCGSSKSEETSETLRWVMDSKKIEMEAVAYIRGRSLPNMYIIIDEAQNLTPHEVKTIISRAGKGTKVVLCGDPTQIDNPYLDKDSNGLTFTVGTFKGKSLFGHVFLEKTERSELSALAAEVM